MSKVSKIIIATLTVFVVAVTIAFSVKVSEVNSLKQENISLQKKLDNKKFKTGDKFSYVMKSGAVVNCKVGPYTFDCKIQGE